MKRILYIILTIFFCLSMLISCSVSPDETIGLWKYSTDNSIHYIEIRDDGTFTKLQEENGVLVSCDNGNYEIKGKKIKLFLDKNGSYSQYKYSNDRLVSGEFEYEKIDGDLPKITADFAIQIAKDNLRNYLLFDMFTKELKSKYNIEVATFGKMNATDEDPWEINNIRYYEASDMWDVELKSLINYFKNNYRDQLVINREITCSIGISSKGEILYAHVNINMDTGKQN